MLILKRRPEELVEILVPGLDPIRIKFLKITEGHVEVGIDAPKAAEVRRAKQDARK